jgi:hypothetical protein
MQDLITLRLAQLEDLPLYYEWVNESIVRKNSPFRLSVTS